MEMTQLKHLVTDLHLFNSLHRRLTKISKRNDAPIKRQKAELIEVECLNEVDLSWQNALENIIEPEFKSIKAFKFDEIIGHRVWIDVPVA